MPIEDLRRRRGGALIQLIERWQIDEQPRINRSSGYGEQQY
jgi:hypothetical protein